MISVASQMRILVVDDHPLLRKRSEIFEIED